MDRPSSGLIKRPSVGAFGRYTIASKSGALQAIADDIILDAEASGAVTGSATQSVVVLQSAAGSLAIVGTASKNVVVLQSASAALAINGTASQTVTVAQAATGELASAPIFGGGAGVVFVTQSAAGRLQISGTAAQVVEVVQSASGALAVVPQPSAFLYGPPPDVIRRLEEDRKRQEEAERAAAEREAVEAVNEPVSTQSDGLEAASIKARQEQRIRDLAAQAVQGQIAVSAVRSALLETLPAVFERQQAIEAEAAALALAEQIELQRVAYLRFQQEQEDEDLAVIMLLAA